jgi:Spy/CpxP family protein refolding chaperone
MVTKNGFRHFGWWAAGALLILGIVLGGLTGAKAQQQPPLPTLEQLRWNEIQQKLGLTPEQVTTLQNILAANRSTMKSDFQALRTAHQALRTAWNQADAGAISNAAAQVQATRDKLFNDRLQGQLNILNALGPELFKQWTALHKHHRGMRGGRHGFEMGM